MAASFRDNITFGRPFEAEWFHEVKSLLLSAPYATLTPFSRSQVLSACALHEDIEGLPAGYVICKISNMFIQWSCLEGSIMACHHGLSSRLIN